MLPFLAGFILFASTAHCQSPPQQAPEEGLRARPKVGLVLSGGGARGCAHVGVLKVLEELHVPVDFVVGTSMGSIVGGAYAYGMSLTELEAAVTRTNSKRPWSILLKDTPSRDRESFRRKQEQRGFLIDFGLGYRDGEFRLPKGLLQGQNLELELLHLMPEAHDLKSFDQLPLPFRAVAVELGTGKQVVLDSGSLPRALRASMSLPAVFAPIEIGGRLLIDGGLVRNVPVGIARELGADILIVVDIGTPLSNVEVASVLDVTAQMVAILTQQNVDRSLAKIREIDVLITPDLGDMTSADFDRAGESIDRGRDAALAMSARLQKLAVDESTWAAWLSHQRRPAAPLRVKNIRIDNTAGISDEVVANYVRVRPDEHFDIEHLRHDLEGLFGRGDFERATFDFEDLGNGDKELVLRTDPKSWGPTYLRLGLALETDLQGQSGFNLAAQINRREINALGAEWRTDVQVGQQSRVASEFFQPLSTEGVFFAAASVGGDTFEVNAFSGGTRIGFFDIRTAQVNSDIGALFGTWGEFRIGLSRLRGDVDAEVSVPGFTGIDFEDAFVRAQFELDTLDLADFPTKGFVGSITYRIGRRNLGADANYQQIVGGGGGFASVGATTIGVVALAESGLSKSLPLYRTSSLGGFLRLSGLDRNALTSQNSGFVAAIVRHQLGGRTDAFGFPVYVGASIEAGNTWADRADLFRNMRLGGSAFVAIGTPLGPAYLSYGMADGGEKAVYIFLGQLF